MKIKKGDRVRVLTGKDRGRDGVVLAAFPREDRLIVEGVHMQKHHEKPTRNDQQGGIREREGKIHVSNVALISPTDGRPTRAGFRVEPDGTKVRICRRTGAEL